MADKKRLVDANELEAHFHETKMIEIFPYWKELSFETQSELVKFGKALKEMMQNAPTVDAVEVVHGRWVDEYPHVRCSECNAEWFNCRTDNEPMLFYFCPNCGADMRGKKDA